LDFIKEGDDAFVSKNYDLALKSYTSALNEDSSVYRAYYKRANVYYATQNYPKAIYDLNFVINNDAENALAYELKAKIQLELGNIKEAKETYKAVKEVKPKKAADYDAKIKEIDGFETSIAEANVEFEKGNFDAAQQIYTGLINSLPGASHLRIKRAQCYYRAKKYSEVLEDTLRILKIEKKNPEAIFLRGKSFQYTDQFETAMNHFVQCLKIDSGNHNCKEAKEGLEAYKENKDQAEDLIKRGRPEEALDHLQKCIDYDPSWDSVKPELYTMLCRAYLKQKDADNVIKFGEMVTDMDSGKLEVLSLIGEAYILKEQFEKAIEYFQKAVDAGDRSAHAGLDNARRLDKMAKRKDYYKILGIEKTASTKDVKQAFRKLAMKYHPDKVRTDDEEEKKQMHEKYLDINAANEILSDPDKRARYDRGEDLEERRSAQNFQNFNFGGDFGKFFRFNH
jgi:tetratricopeptide (TPR) repeat protein